MKMALKAMSMHITDSNQYVSTIVLARLVAQGLTMSIDAYPPRAVQAKEGAS